MNDNKIENLRWIRIFTPHHIPKYLVEQVRDRDYTVDEFYRYHEINCLIKNGEGQALNPFSHLYVLVNAENIPKGFLWFMVDPLTKDIIIQTYSVDKEYWNGQAVEKLATHIKEFRKKGNLNKIYWITRYPKHSMRHGFKRSENILMEYDYKEEESNIRNNDDLEIDENINKKEYCKINLQ